MADRAEPTLLFVYNVDASPVAMLKDLYQAITTGSTDCSLCDLTFGTLLKDRSWKRFVAELPVDVDFELRSTFRASHPDLAYARFPSAWWSRPGQKPELAIDTVAMNATKDLDDLRDLVGRTVSQRPTA